MSKFKRGERIELEGLSFTILTGPWKLEGGGSIYNIERTGSKDYQYHVNAEDLERYVADSEVRAKMVWTVKSKSPVSKTIGPHGPRKAYVTLELVNRTSEGVISGALEVLGKLAAGGTTEALPPPKKQRKK